MYKTQKSYITKDKKMLDLINENYSLLLCLQHFDIDFSVDNSTVEQLCVENKIDLNAFIVIANLYNGFFPVDDEINKIDNIKPILHFLKKSHSFYIEDKYPELKYYLEKIKNVHTSRDFQLIEQFFNDYFEEVLEHLKYEDDIAFPYFFSLERKDKITQSKSFSAKEYRNHHTDIETKLTDLKNLFLKHIKIKSDLNVKRKFLNTLFGLEFDLKIHSVIEEKVLIPLIERIENEQNE
ncbi:MAG: Iron-sulfur cluster repair protein ScdA [Bacteroidetes bacterium ADurb.Bin041]|nr:MAG: Iron-sulfur cluster repair protein ScdA [Bacteroidetes bacterium ADurb.Bin041]